MSTPLRTLGISVAAIAMAFSVSACAAGVDADAGVDANVSQSNTSIASAGMPNFTGPYASELRQAWTDSDSEFVRSVMSDQMVSDAEWAEVETRIAACFEKNGMKLRGYKDDGSYELDTRGVDPDKANEILPVCEAESGEKWLNFLRFAGAGSANGTPIEVLITECLIRNKVVGADYTAEQYLKDAPEMSFPYLNSSTGPDEFVACSNDPSS